MPCLPAPRGPVGEKDAATATSKHGSLYGCQLQPRVLQREPVGVHGDGLAAEQPHDRVEALLHARPLLVGGDAEHVCVRGELARAAAEHHPTAGEVVEQNHAIGQHQRVVVRQRADAGAELDVLGPFGGDADEHLGRRDDLVPRGVVLADPRLVESEAVHRHDQVEVALDAPASGSARPGEREP